MLVRMLLLVIGFLHIPQATAILLSDQLNLERNAYRVASSFYYISFDEGSSAAYAELEEVVSEMENDLLALQTQNLEKLEQVKLSWQVLKKFSRNNNIKKDGYTQTYAEVDLNASRKAFVRTLQESRQESGGDQSISLQSLQLATEMQRLAMHYAEGSVSLMGFPYDELDADAKLFGKQLRALDQEVSAQKLAGSQSMKEALKAWIYIENAMIQYYEVNVPELIKRMNQVIVSKLIEVSET